MSCWDVQIWPLAAAARHSAAASRAHWDGDPDRSLATAQPCCDFFAFYSNLSPTHILLFSSVENCFPFPIAMKSSFFIKKTCTGSVCTLGTSGRLSTVSVKLIFHHEKGLHNNCTNLSWEPLKVFCDPWYIRFKYLTFRLQRHKLSAPTVYNWD